MSTHQPVMLEEVLQALAPRAQGRYVDATYGRGGHAAAILTRLGTTGRLLVIDQDPEAVSHARATLGHDPRVSVRQANFGELDRIVVEVLGSGGVDGVLLDLGVSSPQLDDAVRGFSFQADGPLDMRMNPEAGQSAAQWLAHAPEREIVRVLREYGEERHARRIARRIIAARAESAITTTAQLAAIISACVPGHLERKHPATRSFQAIRIFINRELEVLTQALAQAEQLLAQGGRLCVISFHSLEDRIVKRYLRRASLPDPVYAGLPDIPAHARPRLRLLGRAVRAGEAELARNPRARSAVLRAAERL
ncbi:MAG: 16S rRNA (cytosine(1402)-N(4))-methyltransferase RsmH [Gammaproteobacteria bacterium]|nr:16S rRNA (cytosine(1402)-N(4))-methyltransferase RsmH [Gammaproteobacteria bacterium]